MFQASKVPKSPLLAVVGATGTGKSKLAVELAIRFNGEVINGDALQLYEGLPTATNKISETDRKGVPHHLLGCITLDNPTWTIRKFSDEATRIIENVRMRKKLPILVGGSHYYTQSLLFRGQIIDGRMDDDHVDQEPWSTEWPILNKTGPEMLEVLQQVDPDMASKWHPNDTRKIRRSLEIWLRTGKQASEIYKEQRTDTLSSKACKAMSLCSDTLVFWVHTDHVVLSQRTSARLELMRAGDLLNEICYMHQYYKDKIELGKPVDRTRGIWIAIGYKEFERYFEALEDGTSKDRLLVLCDQALERAKVSTRQYAKRQVRWIRTKLLPAMRSAAAGDNLFLLDSTNLTSWDRNVVDNAFHITNSFLEGASLPKPEQLSHTAQELLSNEEQASHVIPSRYCSQCDITCTTNLSWDGHLRSKRHRKLSKPTPCDKANRRPITTPNCGEGGRVLT